VIGRQVMAPDVVTAFSVEWNRLVSEHGGSGETCRRELQAVEPKIGNLIDALSEGIRSLDFENQTRGSRGAPGHPQMGLASEAAPLPAMHPNIANLYTTR
jgi:hypothetical protein